MPTKEEIKDWLKGIGKDRFWLADKCGVEKVSVDGWFTSRGRVPSYALLVIQNLMKNTTEASMLSECSSDESLLSSLNFSPEEMEIVRGFQKNFPGIDLESYLRSKVIDLCTGLDKQCKYIAERSECENDKKEDAGE